MEEESYSLNGVLDGDAKDIIREFYNRSLSNSPGGKINETLSVWFDFDKFEKFFNQLKKESGNANKPASGVRIYFANYGNTNLGHTLKYPNRNTVVFVSTYEDGNKHRDYFIPRKNMDKGLIDKTDPVNKGVLCPPETNCDCLNGIINCNEVSQ